MFEKIVLRCSDKGPTLSIGELAEALLFYQNVHLVLDYSSLGELISKIGMPTLLSLISRPNITAVYADETLGTQTDTVAGTEIHSFIAFTLAGHKNTVKLNNPKERVEYVLIRNGYKKKYAKRLSEAFIRKVPARKLSNDHFTEGGIVNAAWDDLLDPSFIHEAMRLVLIDLVGKDLLPTDLRFIVKPNRPKFQIETNLQLQEINKLRKSRNSRAEDITIAHLINNILMARADTILSSHYGGEFYTSNLASEIIRLHHKDLLRRIGIDKKELREFSEIVVNDAPTIREVINSGERTFSEFLLLLDKSQKFREWAHGIHPDEKLVKEYWKYVTSEGWISTLPSKIIRYIIGATIGAIEPIMGLSFSAADSLLVDRILNGWRPSHFVERTYKPFVNKENE